MADVSITTSHKQGFDFSNDIQVPVGFVTALKIGEDELEADLKGKDPMSPTDDIEAVGMINNIYWSTEITGALEVSMQVSTQNKSTLKVALLQSLTNTKVEINFDVFEYDSIKDPQSYFLSCHSDDASLLGSIVKNNGQLALSVSDEPDTLVQQPQNFTVNLSIFPEPVDQAIHLAASETHKLVKQWGMNG